jgi:hypothetical protein
VPRLDSGYASKPKNLASAACGYLQGITVKLDKPGFAGIKNFK